MNRRRCSNLSKIRMTYETQKCSVPAWSSRTWICRWVCQRACSNRHLLALLDRQDIKPKKEAFPTIYEAACKEQMFIPQTQDIQDHDQWRKPNPSSKPSEIKSRNCSTAPKYLRLHHLSTRWYKWLHCLQRMPKSSKCLKRLLRSCKRFNVSSWMKVSLRKIRKSISNSTSIKRLLRMALSSLTLSMMSINSIIGLLKMCCNWQKMLNQKRRPRRSKIWMVRQKHSNHKLKIWN